MSIISVSKLVKTYVSGEVETRVLREVDLEVKKGEWLAIMGMSGAGKSTLMYQMALLDTPTSGDITVMDNNTALMKDSERTQFRLAHFGYVFQDYALLPELSATENVIIPLMMQGMETADAIWRAEETLDRLGLGERLRNLPSQLSGGEQQRVSIARAVAKHPHILFTDEPTANLDSVSSEGVIDALRDLHKEGQSIVMVTHEHRYTQHCDRVVVMEDGVVTKERKPYRGS